MSVFVTADLCILSLGFFEIRFATFECVVVTFILLLLSLLLQ